MLVWLLHNTVLAAVLALGVAFICRWKRVGPALRHALWVLVLLRLIWPPGLVTWPWPLPSLSIQNRAAAAETAVAAPAPSGESLPDGVEIIRVAVRPDPALEEQPVLAEAAPAVAGEPIAWWPLAWWTALGIWALGAAVVAVRHLHGLSKLVRVLRVSEPATASTVRHVAETAIMLGIRPPRVRVVAGLGSPLIAGLWRPVLLWPRELQNHLPEDGLKAVLIHELAHLRRRDHWVRWVEMAAGCVWWWNPLYRLARRRVRQYAELACDAWVLAMLPRARRAYAEALLQVCASVSNAAPPAPALGVGGDPIDFQRRLTMIMREKVPCRLPRRALVVLLLLAALTVPGWSLGGDPAPVPEAVDARLVTADDVDHLRTIAAGDLLLELLDADVYRIGAEPDREKRLADIEAQIKVLLREIQALRAERAGARTTDSRTTAARALAELAGRHEDDVKKQREYAARLREDLARKAESAARMEAGSRNKATSANEIILHRIRYELAPAKAQALATFLKDFVKDGMLDCSVEGDRLIVTTTPENQNVIGRLIKLIQDLPSSSGRR